MVPGGTKQGSRRNGKGNQDLREVKQVEALQNSREEKDSLIRKAKRTEFVGGCSGESRVPKVNPAIQETHME
jgi:hypothetical protein